jgi:hypothetical protein
MEHLDAKTSHGQFWTHKTHHGPNSGEATTFPHIVFSAPLYDTCIQMAFLSRDSQGGVPKLSRFGFPPLCGVITLCPDLRLGWGLKQTCSSRRELSNSVPHSTYTHPGRVDSRLLMVGSQTASLTPGLSFCHNLCCRCPNDSCEPLFDIYISINFQWYKKCHNARCFDPCNRTLKFRESRWTPKFPFRECEFHPHTLLKVRLQHKVGLRKIFFHNNKNNEFKFFFLMITIAFIKDASLSLKSMS